MSRGGLALALGLALACGPEATPARPAAANSVPVTTGAVAVPVVPAPGGPVAGPVVPAPGGPVAVAEVPAVAGPLVPVSPVPVMPVPEVERIGVVSNLKGDEELRLLPVVATRDGDGWRVRVHVWVFEPEGDSWRRDAAISGLAAALGLPAGSEANAVFRRRARLFLVDNERGKRVVVRIGSKEHVLKDTDASGHSETVLHLADADLPAPVSMMSAVLPPGDRRGFSGVIVRMGEGGVSVVSDVDDTIKISEVGDRRRLLERTFLREFEPVPGMARLYQQWAAAGASFHYLSASPWQLYEPLLGFLEQHGFPVGSMHLKRFRLADASFLSLFEGAEAYKGPLLRGLIAAAPGRRFVLVGDSGERDPEVYAEALRRFPGQVAAIYIRDVTGEGRDAPRYRTTFADVPADRWQLVAGAGQIPPALP